MYNHEVLPFLHERCFLAVATLDGLVIAVVQVLPVEIVDSMCRVGILVIFLVVFGFRTADFAGLVVRSMLRLLCRGRPLRLIGAYTSECWLRGLGVVRLVRPRLGFCALVHVVGVEGGG